MSRILCQSEKMLSLMMYVLVLCRHECFEVCQYTFKIFTNFSTKSTDSNMHDPRWLFANQNETLGI